MRAKVALYALVAGIAGCRAIAGIEDITLTDGGGADGAVDSGPRTPVKLFTPDGATALQLRLDDTHVYFADETLVERCAKTGCTKGELLFDSFNGLGPLSLGLIADIALGGTSKLVVSVDDDQGATSGIVVMNRDGTGLADGGAPDAGNGLFRTCVSCQGVDADATTVTFADRGNGTNGTVQQCPLAGPCNAPQTVVSGIKAVRALRVAAGFAWYTYGGATAATTAIGRCALPGPCPVMAGAFEAPGDILSLTATASGVVFIANRALHRWDASAPQPVMIAMADLVSLATAGDRVFGADSKTILTWPLAGGAASPPLFVGGMAVDLQRMAADARDLFFYDGDAVQRLTY